MTLERTTIPLYVQIADGLIERIESAELVPGDRLPSERELSKKLGVTRVTLRQALGLLEAQGLLIRKHGVGTYIANLKVEREADQLVPFSKGVKARGLQPGARVIKIEKVSASYGVAQKLNLEAGQAIFYSHRLRFINQEATMLEKYALPVQIVPDWDRQDLVNHSIYETLQSVYGIVMTTAVQSLEAVPATAYEAELLSIKVGTPLILEQRVGYDQNGRPIEFAKDLYRGDRFRFVSNVTLRSEAINGNGNSI